jgi:hypothetical protein
VILGILAAIIVLFFAEELLYFAGVVLMFSIGLAVMTGLWVGVYLLLSLLWGLIT